MVYCLREGLVDEWARLSIAWASTSRQLEHNLPREQVDQTTLVRQQHWCRCVIGCIDEALRVAHDDMASWYWAEGLAYTARGVLLSVLRTPVRHRCLLLFYVSPTGIFPGKVYALGNVAIAIRRLPVVEDYRQYWNGSRSATFLSASAM